MSATLSRWSRLFVAGGVCWLVAWQAAVVAGLPRRTAVALALYGFVFHVVFGKAYSLVPSYFDRGLAAPRAVPLHLALAVVGAAGLAVAPLDGAPESAAQVGAVAWAAGVAVFLATMGVTLRDNPLGAETGTGDHNARRRPVDRAANLFVPVVFAYLAVGTLETLGTHTAAPLLLDGYPPRATHLLAAGAAALLVFAVGFRLLPRFLVVDASRPLVYAVLPAGAVGPALVAVGLPSGPLFHLGAAVEALAVIGFAAAVLVLFVRTERDRVGFYGPLLGGFAGAVGVGLGLTFAFDTAPADLVVAHYRLNLLGFLGLTIVGVSYQFYPPTVGRFPGADDRLALATMGAIAVGLLLEVVAAGWSATTVARGGQALALAGSVGYAYLVLGVFIQRARG